ncbi:MAG: hypothetical protein KDM64_19435, partial [Verrucomicrobiae bacterium]|nr:hypothetical protein [Verrucomicrobiae bacterium]
MSESPEPTERTARGFTLSMALLIGSNLIPLVGIFAWGWKVFDVVALYWIENVIVGVINLLKMLICSPDPAQVDFRNGEPESAGQPSLGKLAAVHHASKLFFMPFFAVHYGIFTAVHGMFVFSMLGRRGGAMSGSLPDGLGRMVGEVMGGDGKWAVLALLVSHLVSFAQNYLLGGEFRRATVPVLLFAPYGRVVVLHVAILAGAFAIQAMGSPMVLLVILIAGKIGLD